MSSFPSQSSQRSQGIGQKMRCAKPAHKSQPIQFLCIDTNCRASTRQGCLTCFPEHDGHTQNHMEIDDFFREVHLKEKSAEQEYQLMVSAMDTKKSKDAITKRAQTSFKTLMQKVFSFLDRHQEYVTHYILAHAKSVEVSSNFEIKMYHDELDRIKVKPISTLENKDVNFLLSFLHSEDYESMIQTQKRNKDSSTGNFAQQIDGLLHQFDEQFSQAMTYLDQTVVQTLGKQQQQSGDTRNSPSSQKTRFTNPTSPIANRQQNKSQTRQRTQTSPQKKGGPGGPSKTPEPKGRQRKPKQPAPQRFLMTTPEAGNDKFIAQNKNLENFIQYVQLSYLKEDVLNENLEFLVHNYPEVFGVFEDERITSKDRIQLLQEHKAHVLKIMWDNWIVEWLGSALQQGGLVSNITIKVHEIEDSYFGFLELLEKSMQIHGIVAWLVKQKLNRPKVEYHTWLILAQGTSNKGGVVSNEKVYRLYHIKSAQRRDYREPHMLEDSAEQRDLRGLYGFTLAKIMQDSLHGDFKISDDSKVIVKGLIDPNFQTFLMAERLQIFLNLAVFNLSKQGHVMNLYALESQFDSMMINFSTFVNTLSTLLREYGDYKPNDQGTHDYR